METLEPIQFLDKTKSLRKSPFKLLNKPTEVTCELLTQDGKNFRTLKSFDSILSQRIFAPPSLSIIH